MRQWYYNKTLIVLNTGWNSRSHMEELYLNIFMPLNMLLSFCEDYKRVVVNARHELILIQSRNDYNCLVGNFLWWNLVQRGETPDQSWRLYLKMLSCTLREKRRWLWNLLLYDGEERMYIEILDAVYEDMESLTNLDDCNTIRCDRHAKNCALQNVFKIFNWWLRCQ